MGPLSRRRLAVLALSLLGAVALACTDTAVAPEPDPVTPSDDTLRVGVVVQEDEILLRGHLFGSENEPLVVLSHMRPNDQAAWFGFAEELAANGFAAFTYDFRGYGESEGEQDFAKLDDDLSAVVEYWRGRGRDEILLVGASMGGTTSLVVASQLEVDGVVAVSAPSEFEGQDAVAAMPLIDTPKLFLASEDDTAAILSLDELLEVSAGPTEQERYAGNAHGTDMFATETSEHAASVRARVLRFLQEHGRG